MITQQVSLLPGTKLTEDAQIFEYSTAANPIESGSTPRIPIRDFSAELYSSGPSRIVPLDLSVDLNTPYLATGPSLLANFVRINAGESLATDSNASSEFYFVIYGRGRTETTEGAFTWEAGDFVALPGLKARHHADENAAFYLVNDSPLLAYLGVQKSRARFQPTLYTREAVISGLNNAKNGPNSSRRSRTSVLLANKNFAQTMTITHTLWTMFGVISPRTHQLPHRHQSVALDFVVDARPGVYTLLGAELNEDGTIKDAIRVDWVRGTAFVTPPRVLA
jgi:mannose-6-phosphate isomerase-like protein (cupin superfamily)